MIGLWRTYYMQLILSSVVLKLIRDQTSKGTITVIIIFVVPEIHSDAPQMACRRWNINELGSRRFIKDTKIVAVK